VQSFPLFGIDATICRVKPVFEKTPLLQWESLHCEVVRGDSFNSTWHFHPELQITLVLSGTGYRLVGDKITPLRPGDMVLVGSNLPHVWRQDAAGKRAAGEVNAIIVRFQENFAGEDFLKLPEAQILGKLFQRARRGMEIHGGTRTAVAERLQKLSLLGGLARLTELISVLDLLANSRDLRAIASRGFVPDLSTDDQDRMRRVTQYIDAHLAERIDRDEVARTAHLSVSAFSRFFKIRTGKSLPGYVNELRVGRACRLLANDRRKVTDIAFECGFQNLANFNRHFHKIQQMTPSAYRRDLRRSSG